jgi:hypothetical protein
MAEKVEDEPGTFFLGVSGGFKCFPRTIQKLEFSVRSESQEPRLAARTKEGLKLEMDIMIEYELQKDNIRALYDLAAAAAEIPFFWFFPSPPFFLPFSDFLSLPAAAAATAAIIACFSGFHKVRGSKACSGAKSRNILANSCLAFSMSLG